MLHYVLFKINSDWKIMQEITTMLKSLRLDEKTQKNCFISLCKTICIFLLNPALENY